MLQLLFLGPVSPEWAQLVVPFQKTGRRRFAVDPVSAQ